MKLTFEGYHEMRILKKETQVNVIAAHPFEWFATLTFKEPVNQELARKRVRNWTRKIIRAEEMRLGWIAVVRQDGNRCHWHLLMLGLNKWGKRLRSVSIERWAREWCKENCAKSISWRDGARIIPVHEISGVSRYLIENLTPDAPILSDLLFHDKKLLMKSRRYCRLETSSVSRRQNHHLVFMRRRKGSECRIER
jgi:hypothetical protein